MAMGDLLICIAPHHSHGTCSETHVSDVGKCAAHSISADWNQSLSQWSCIPTTSAYHAAGLRPHRAVTANLVCDERCPFVQHSRPPRKTASHLAPNLQRFWDLLALQTTSCAFGTYRSGVYIREVHLTKRGSPQLWVSGNSSQAFLCSSTCSHCP